jgi:hypothetical protein
MSDKRVTLGDLFLEEETRLVEKARVEIAQEKAAWDALPQADKDRINAEREAQYENMVPDNPDDDEQDEEQEEEEEDDEDFHDSDDDLDTLHSR